MSSRALPPYDRRLAFAVTAVTLGLAIAACGADSTRAAAISGQGDELGHVHGLGVNPADDALYVASHLGIYRMEDGQQPVRVADRYQDTMGFTVVGPDRFLASGHPDLRENLPSCLGLIYSTDAARSWTPLSLQGQADFHILEPTPDRLYAYDALSGRLLTTSGKPWEKPPVWQPAAQLDLADLAADPAQTDALTATAGSGQLLHSTDGGLSFAAVADAPNLVLVDWAQTGQLVGVDAQGGVFVSSGPTTPWRTTTTVPGHPQALDAVPGRWHIATDRDILTSTDDGRTWQPVQHR
jgi:hypothetical protein